MDFKTALLKENSKSNSREIAQAVFDFPEYIEDLMECHFEPGWRYSQRATWSLELIAKEQPKIVLPYIKPLLDTLLNHELHDGIRRNSVRLLQFLELPEEDAGIAFDKCYQLLDDPDEPIAIRVFAMTVLVNICKKEPDLASEVRHTIEKHLPYGSAGFKSRGRKMTQVLLKLERNS